MKLGVVADNSAVSYHRLILPADTLCIDNISLIIGKPIDKYDVVIFNRLFDGTVEELHKEGSKVIVDIDDYWELPKEHPLYNLWYENKYDERIPKNIREADMVWCTNEQLKEKILPLNKNVHVIPNALPFGYDQFKPKKKRDGKPPVRFIWAGGSTHLNDLRLLESTLEKINLDNNLKSKTKFCMGGYSPGLNWEAMKRIFQKTSNNIIIPSLDLFEYMKVYDNMDVALVPLKPNDFSIHKSVLKILEAASKKMPCIVSNTLPYTEINCDGVLFVEKEEDWIKHIKTLTHQPKAIKAMGQNLYEYCKEKYDLKKWSEVRYELIHSL